MGEDIEPVTLTRGVYWVGAIDWNLRDFHGYVTPRGTTKEQDRKIICPCVYRGKDIEQRGACKCAMFLK